MARQFVLLLFTTLLSLSLHSQVRFSPERLIDEGVDRPRGMDVADIDNDGDPDVVGNGYIDGVITWYPNLGDGTFGGRRYVTLEATGVEEVHVADIDRDGFKDIIAASRLLSTVTWYRNRGDGSFDPGIVVSTTAMGCIDVFAADVDADGELDILSASLYDSKIAWYQNRGELGFGPEKVIEDSALAARSVFAADINGDSLVDVLSASRADHKLSYYLNLGAGVFGPRVSLTDTAYGARDIKAIDLDGDGDLDIIGAAYESDKVLWFENQSSPGGPLIFSGAIALVSDIEGPRSVAAADLDLDGDLDLLSGSEFDFRLAWYENLGGSGAGLFGPMQTITARLDGVRMVLTADVDLDGDPDVLGAGSYVNRFEWFENQLDSDVPLALSEFARNLSEPVDMDFIPAEDPELLIVAERRGLLKAVDESGRVLPEDFLDLRSAVTDLPFIGMVSVAFPENHLTDGRFYVTYVNGDSLLVLSRFTRNLAGSLAVDTTTEEKLLELQWPVGKQVAGDLAFGPDGFLYMAVGDGAVSPSWKLAQEPGVLQGKIIRLDVDVPTGYAIPAGNPGTLRSAVADEIWAAGVHNPLQLSLDSETGDLWFTDLGMDSVDEVHWRQAGSKPGPNFGWPCIEGAEGLSTISDCGSPSLYVPADFAAPISSELKGLVGGQVYRGDGMPAYIGHYPVADFGSGDWYWLSAASDSISLTSSIPGLRSGLSSFTANDRGELFAGSESSGTIYRLDQRCGPDVPVTGLREEFAEGALYLKWDPVPGAVSYRLQIQRTDTTAVSSKSGALTAFRINSIDAGYDYAWRVQPGCEDFSTTEVGVWSEYDTFTVAALRTAQEDMQAQLHLATDGQMLLSLEAFSGDWSVHNIMGIELGSGSMSIPGQLRLNLEGWTPGTYFLTIRGIAGDLRTGRFAVH